MLYIQNHQKLKRKAKAAAAKSEGEGTKTEKKNNKHQKKIKKHKQKLKQKLNQRKKYNAQIRNLIRIFFQLKIVFEKNQNGCNEKFPPRIKSK